MIRCIKYSVGGFETCLVLSADQQASMASLGGMLVYNDLTSSVASIVPGGTLEMGCNLFRKSAVSLM